MVHSDEFGVVHPMLASQVWSLALHRKRRLTPRPVWKTQVDRITVSSTVIPQASEGGYARI